MDRLKMSNSHNRIRDYTRKLSKQSRNVRESQQVCCLSKNREQLTKGINTLKGSQQKANLICLRYILDCLLANVYNKHFTKETVSFMPFKECYDVYLLMQYWQI